MRINIEELKPGDVTTVRQASDTLGIHFATLYRWIKSGDAIWVKFGNTAFIPVLEVKRLQDLQVAKMAAKNDKGEARKTSPCGNNK